MKSLKNPMNPSVIAWEFHIPSQVFVSLYEDLLRTWGELGIFQKISQEEFLVVAPFCFSGRQPSNFFCGSSPCLGSQKIYLLLFRAGTLCPIIMEVEHYPKWKETKKLKRPIFHFHDYGRKGTCTVTQETIYFRLGPPSLRQNPRKKQSYWWTHLFALCF